MTDALLRPDGRALNELRPLKLTNHVMKHAQGSCMAEFGDTKVLCTATIEETLPAWRKASHQGWVTAEYAMLPASTNTRSRRELKGRKGRSMEIERLVGRSLRSAVNLRALGEITVTIDCDVIQADGGTRCASITGGWVALYDALALWKKAGRIPSIPMLEVVGAVSVAQVDGVKLLDPNYEEDSHAEVDMNVVGTGTGDLVEVQGTGERVAFPRKSLDELLDLAEKGLAEVTAAQMELTGWSRP